MNQMPAKGTMLPRDASEATAFLEAHPEVRAYHCFLTDLGGVARGKVLRPVELERAFRDGRPLPGSILGLDITGADVEETGLVWEDGDADRLCWPVAGTLVPQPWSEEPSAQFLLSSYEADGSGSAGDPRHALTRVVERFKPLGLTPVAAVELEFYLFDPSVIETGKPLPPRTAGGARPAQLQAYLMQDLEDFAPFLEDLYRGGEAMGLPLGGIPRHALGHRHLATEVGDGADDRSRLPGHFVVAREDPGEGLVGPEPEVVFVVGDRRVAVTLEDHVDPTPLGVGGVFDEPADAQRPGRRSEARLFIGQAVGRVANAVSLLLDVGEQQCPLVAQRGRLSGHRDLRSVGDTPVIMRL
jgi:hypothetical protein